MDWKMSIQDFQFMTQLEPEGCFSLFDGLKLIGIATSISYGKVGWFGNLIVKKEYRNRGAGSLLVKHGVDYLHAKNVETIGLYAYPELVNFYGELGFLLDEHFALLHTENLGSSKNESLPNIGKRNIQAINRFDNRYFVGNRQRLLKSIIFKDKNIGQYVSEGDEVKGYAAATVYERNAWVGPLICQAARVDVAVLLVRSVLSKLDGKNVYSVLPKKETSLVETFFRVGFIEDFSVTRMFLGKAIAKNCIYMAESLERG
jgi:hypothetical protein